MSGDQYSCPNSRMSQWRACLGCKIIKTAEEFEDGCSNCSNMSSYGNCNSWTTSNFTGVVAIMDDQKSWVSKHQNLVGKIPGLYAIVVKGKLQRGYDADDQTDY